MCIIERNIALQLKQNLSDSYVATDVAILLEASGTERRKELGRERNSLYRHMDFTPPNLQKKLIETVKEMLGPDFEALVRQAAGKLCHDRFTKQMRRS